MRGKKAEELLQNIELAFGLTKEDFIDGRPIYVQWPGASGKTFDLEDLGGYSLKISKKLGDVYIDKISTDKWVVVGKGTTLHCHDITVGEELINNFEGFLM